MILKRDTPIEFRQAHLVPGLQELIVAELGHGRPSAIMLSSNGDNVRGQAMGPRVRGCNESQKDRGFRWILFEGFCAVNKTRKNRVFFCQEKWDRVSKDWTDIADVTTKIKLWLLAAFCKLTWNFNRRF